MTNLGATDTYVSSSSSSESELEVIEDEKLYSSDSYEEATSTDEDTTTTEDTYIYEDNSTPITVTSSATPPKLNSLFKSNRDKREISPKTVGWYLSQQQSTPRGIKQQHQQEAEENNEDNKEASSIIREDYSFDSHNISKHNKRVPYQNYDKFIHKDDKINSQEPGSVLHHLHDHNNKEEEKEDDEKIYTCLNAKTALIVPFSWNEGFEGTNDDVPNEK